jgi:type IV pilus assembly protein PilW
MNRKGFSLVELIVVIAIFAIVIGIPYKLFIQELKTTVREVSLSQTSIENVPALEIIRKDIETAGYGLPWNLNSMTYQEVSSSTPSLYSLNQNIFNDASSSPPRAIVGKKDTKHGFSYLVLKSTSFGLNKASNHWSYIDDNGSLNIWPTANSANYNNLQSGDRAIIMDAGSRALRGGSLYFTITKDADVNDTDPSSYINGYSLLPSSLYLLYGVDTSTPRAPFNRIDYRLYDGKNDPSECASGTHTLGRAIMKQGSGIMKSYPLLHCIADFQVIFKLSDNTETQDMTNFNANDVKEKLKQVRVYILTQNGIKDKSYTYPSNSIFVGDNSTGKGRDFDLTQIADYQHYRWKVLKLVAVPKNLE